MKTKSIALFVSVFIATAWNAAPASAEITWKRDTQRVLADARKSKKPILVFVSAKWCHYCQKMKQETWSDASLSEPVSRTFETLILDGDRDKEIVDQLGLQGFPETLVYTSEGQLIDQKGGFMTVSQTMDWLRTTLR